MPGWGCTAQPVHSMGRGWGCPGPLSFVAAAAGKRHRPLARSQSSRCFCLTQGEGQRAGTLPPPTLGCVLTAQLRLQSNLGVPPGSPELAFPFLGRGFLGPGLAHRASPFWLSLLVLAREGPAGQSMQVKPGLGRPEMGRAGT